MGTKLEVLLSTLLRDERLFSGKQLAKHCQSITAPRFASVEKSSHEA
jgi:hypothetical protein